MSPFRIGQDEVWRPVVGFEGAYEVSSLGRVRGVDRILPDGRKWKGRMLKPRRAGGKGYLALQLQGKQQCYVHTLVLTAFVGPRPDGMEACHFPDPDPMNNRIDNLRWGTSTENGADMVKHGTSTRGEKNPAAKFTEADIQQIFALRRQGLIYPQIANVMGCHRNHVGKILRGESWRHTNHV